MQIQKHWSSMILALLALISLILIPLVEIIIFPLGIMVYASYAVIWTLLFSPLILFRMKAEKLYIYIAFLFLLCILYWIPWNERKVFVHDLYSIHPGMTQAEAIKRMARWGDGKISSPIPLSTFLRQHKGVRIPEYGPQKLGEKKVAELYYKHKDKEYDADAGLVCISDGRVILVEFLPD